MGSAHTKKRTIDIIQSGAVDCNTLFWVFLGTKIKVRVTQDIKIRKEHCSNGRRVLKNFTLNFSLANKRFKYIQISY